MYIGIFLYVFEETCHFQETSHTLKLLNDSKVFFKKQVAMDIML